MSTYDVGYITYHPDSDRIISIEALRRPESGSGPIGGGPVEYQAERVMDMIRNNDVFTSRIDSLGDMIFDIAPVDEGGPYLRLDPEHPLIDDLRQIGERRRERDLDPYR